MNIMAKLAAVLGPLVASRAYPNTLPQAPTYPAIAFQFIANPPAAGLTQLARFTDFHAQVTLHTIDYPELLALRQAALSAVEAMAEYVTRDTDIEGAYEFEPKTRNWILGFHLRDAET